MNQQSLDPLRTAPRTDRYLPPGYLSGYLAIWFPAAHEQEAGRSREPLGRAGNKAKLSKITGANDRRLVRVRGPEARGPKPRMTKQTQLPGRGPGAGAESKNYQTNPIGM
jgi:hypothetical protein